MEETIKELVRFINERALYTNELNGVGTYRGREKLETNNTRRTEKAISAVEIWNKIIEIINAENNSFSTKVEKFIRSNRITDGLDASIYAYGKIIGRVETKAYNDRSMSTRFFYDAIKLSQFNSKLKVFLFVLEQATGEYPWKEYMDDTANLNIKYVSLYPTTRGSTKGLPEIITYERVKQIIDEVKTFLLI